MTLREREVAGRRRVFRKQQAIEHRDRVLSLRQWCEVNGFSKATGWRMIKRGEGPPVLQLSPRRIGIRESDNARWQASRIR
jgi:predicted DNA-binding transcriptional regulator AlpA